MSRILTVFMLAAGIIGGVTAAQAYHLPPDYHDGDHEGDPLLEADDPYFADDPDSDYLDVRHRYRRHHDGGYHGRPRHYDGGYYGRHYDGYPGYGHHHLDDRPYRRGYRGYHDDYAEEPLHDEEPGNVRERDRGFDPRRPHLGDGTDAPTEQYYPYRPRSCGEYYYWDGQACVDARKYPPYVGPKQ
jgi:hypothetical protein